MNRSLFHSLLQQNASGSGDGDIIGTLSKSSNPSSPSSMKMNLIREWIKFSNQQANQLFTNGQYTKIINKASELEHKLATVKTSSTSSSSNTATATTDEELVNDFYYLAMMMDKKTCSHHLNGDDEQSLEGIIAHIRTNINSLLMTNCSRNNGQVATVAADENIQRGLLFGLKVYLLSVINDNLFSTTRKSKEVLSSLSECIIFAMNSVLRIFTNQTVQENFASLQEAIDFNFSGHLFEDESMSHKKKKRKKSKSAQIPGIDYSKKILKYFSSAMKDSFIGPMLHFHIALARAINLFNSVLMSKRKLSKILENSYNENGNGGIIHDLLYKLKSLSTESISDRDSQDVEEEIRFNQMHISISLLEAEKLDRAQTQCKRCKNFVPAIYLLAIVLLQKGDVKASKDCFLKVIEKSQHQQQQQSNNNGGNQTKLYNFYQSQSSHMIALLFMKEQSLNDCLNWLQKASKIESDPLKKVESMYNMCKIRDYLGEYHPKRKILLDIYHILINETLNLDQEEKNASIVSPFLILNHIGYCLVGEESYFEALQCFEYLIRNLISAEDKRLWGKLNQHSEHPDESVSPLQLLKMYIYCLLQTHSYEKALRICDYAIKKLGGMSSPSPDVMLLLYKCDAMMALEKPLMECEQVLNEAFKSQEELSKYSRLLKSVIHNNKAMMLLCKYQYEDACSLIKKAFVLLPETYHDSKLLNDIQCSIVFNLALTSLSMDKLKDAVHCWFSLRKIPQDQSPDFYFELYEEREQILLEQTVSNSVSGADDFMLLSHVSGKCTIQQAKAMDLFLLKTYGKFLKDSKKEK